MSNEQSPEGYYNGEFPFTRPQDSDASMFIQWKNTNLCMDFACECGEQTHGDDYFAHFVKCGACGAIYQLGTQVVAKRVEKADIRPLVLAPDEPEDS